jgi:soluble P-type ATPase
MIHRGFEIQIYVPAESGDVAGSLQELKKIYCVKINRTKLYSELVIS